MKSRKEKAEEYDIKYSHLSKDNNERLNNLLMSSNMINKKDAINSTIERMNNELEFIEILFILYEEPEGAPRPRFRLINRKNLGNMALANNHFVHVYSPVAMGDSKYMKRLRDDEILELNDLIYTPCILTIDAYLKIPKVFNRTETILAEMGQIRPVCKPDWDNIGKKYSDMMNGIVWYDDAYVISGTVNKYYSTLPRVEIKIQYLNKLYNRYQYKSLINKIDGELSYFGMEEK